MNEFANRSEGSGAVVVAATGSWKTGKQQTRADEEARVVLGSRRRRFGMPPGAARPARTIEDPFGRVWGCDRARLNNRKARLNGVERTITHRSASSPNLRAEARAAPPLGRTALHFRRSQPLTSLQFFQWACATMASPIQASIHQDHLLFSTPTTLFPQLPETITVVATSPA